MDAKEILLLIAKLVWDSPVNKCLEFDEAETSSIQSD